MNTRMNRNRLNIGTYFLRPYACSEAHVKDLADCGIDFVVCMQNDPKTLDLFTKYNVGAIVTGILPGWWGGDGDNAGTMREKNPWSAYEKGAASFKDHPAIWGIDTGDEPSALDFPYYGEVLKFVEKNFPKQFPYLNLYPNYASVAKNNAQQTVNQLGTPTYAEHIDRYCENIAADYICYDFYMYSASVAGHYENLRIVADACRKSGRSLWIVLQVNSNKPEKWISENQLRAQAYSSMAFGAENIIWACYTAGWWHNQVLDDKGNKTQQYDKLKTVNAELHALSDEYMRFRNASTHFVGFKADSPWLAKLQNTKPLEALNTGVFRDVKAANGAELIIGQMFSRKADGSYALMVCAADDPQDTANKTFDVTFRCDDFKVKAVGAPLTKLADGSYSISMKSCGGALIVAE